MKKIADVMLTVVLVMLFAVVGMFSASAVTMNTVDGGTAELYSSEYDLTITVFGRTTCYNTKTVLTSLKNLGISNKSNIKVNYADINKDSKETVAKLASSYEGSDISFCYDETSTLSNLMWKYASAQGMSGSITLPFTVYIDSSGNVLDATTCIVSESVLSSIAENVKIYNELFTLSVKGTENYDYAYDVLELLNELRTSLGLSELTMNEELLDVAMQRAAEIALYYSHTRPNGTSCFSLYSKGYVGENIAIGQTSPAAVMEAWTNSSGHYANMTSGKYNSVGIGAFKMSDGTLCWVQFFGSATAANYEKSGTKDVATKVETTFGRTDIEVYADVYNAAGMAPGDTFGLKLVNYNVEFPYADQTLLLSDFEFIAAESDALSVSADGTVTVKGKGSVKVPVVSKSNSKVVFTKEISAGHDHDYNLYSTKNVKTGCVTKTTKTYLCYMCGDSYTESSTKTTHTVVTDKAVKATCTKSGKTKGSHCSVCGKVFTAQKTVKATGHTSDAGTVTKKATYFAEGVKTYKCTVCSKVLKTEKLAKLKLSKVNNLKAKASSSSAIKLSWSKVTGAEKYTVYISTNGKSWTKQGTTTKTSFTVNKLKSGKAYKFKVRASVGNVNGAYSSVVSQATKPGTPTLKVSAGSKKASLSWNKQTCTGYEVYMSTKKTSGFKNVKTITKAATIKFTKTGLTKGKTYYFKVRAYKTVDGKKVYGDYSKVVSVKVK